MNSKAKKQTRGHLDQCETLMLDMDGTVLDLAFDNYVWTELVPERYAQKTGRDIDEVRNELSATFFESVGNLHWYCLDHWSEHLGMDMLALHRDVDHRIGFLPGAENFLKTMKDHSIRVLLVTNSHPDTLNLKDEVTGVTGYFDKIYSSHHYGHAKESQEFWRALRDEEGFSPDTSIMVDDTISVLQSAKTYGIGGQVHITMPDTTRPAREHEIFEGVAGVGDLL